MEQRILENITVLDLANENGVYCTKLMADMGAEVIKVEDTRGDKTRYIGPFGSEEKNIENSLFHAFYNSGKKSIVLDYTTKTGREKFLKLVESADILVETSTPGTMEAWSLGYENLKKYNPGLIMCSITPFGQNGPCAKWKASSDMIPFAMSGPMFESGKPDREPLQLGSNFLANGAGMYALAGIMAALFAKLNGREGAYIDIALSEVAGAWRGLALGEVQKAPDYKIAQRQGSQGLMVPSNFYKCQDGYVFMMASGRWAQVVQWMKDKGIDIGDKDDPKYLADQGFNKYLWADIDNVNAMIGQLASCYKMHEMMEEGQKRRVPVGVAETTETVLESPQLLQRGYFQEIEHPILGILKYPGAAYGFTKTPMRIQRHAPILGEHNAEILERTVLDGKTYSGGEEK